MRDLFGVIPRTTRLAHALGIAEAMTRAAIRAPIGSRTFFHRLDREQRLRWRLLLEQRDEQMRRAS